MGFDGEIFDAKKFKQFINKPDRMTFDIISSTEISTSSYISTSQEKCNK